MTRPGAAALLVIGLASASVVTGCASGALPKGAADEGSAGDTVLESKGYLSDTFDVETVAPAGPDGADPHAHHGHDHGSSTKVDASPEPGTLVFSCPHHPEVQSDKPGKCPKCGMDLIGKPARSPEHEH